MSRPGRRDPAAMSRTLERAVVERVAVPFAGTQSGTAPLTWGQQAILDDMRETGWTHNASGGHLLPPGTEVQDVVRQLRSLMDSHPALRMRLGTDASGRRYQDVAESGEIDLEVVTFGDEVERSEIDEYAYDLWYNRLLEPYDLARDWPMQTTVLRHHGASVYRMLTFHHLAVDGTAVGLLLAEMGIGDMARREDGPSPIDVLELARREQTPKVRQVSDRAMGYWRERLRDIPPLTFGLPRHPEGRQGKRYWHGRFNSPAAYLALLAIARRTGTDTSGVLLALVATAVARATGVCPVRAKVIVSNRFRPGLADVVAPLSQNSIVSVDVAGITVDEAVVRARRASRSAGMHAYYDPDQLARLAAELDDERGYAARVSCRINDRRLHARRSTEEAVRSTEVTMAQILEKRTETYLTWDGTVDMLPEQAFITIEDFPETVALQVIFDMACFTEDEVEALLHGVEEVAIEAAFDPDAPTRV